MKNPTSRTEKLEQILAAIRELRRYKPRDIAAVMDRLVLEDVDMQLRELKSFLSEQEVAQIAEKELQVLTGVRK